jgi:5-methylcytosine-specific restriction endonuclease McrA
MTVIGFRQPMQRMTLMVRRRYIPKPVRERGRGTEERRCAYCQAPEVMTYPRLEVEHIIPRSQGGADAEGNLCLSCRLCNETKGTQTRAQNPQTGRTVALFHPRRQKWSRHFRWTEDGSLIRGRTACGRAVQTGHTGFQLSVLCAYLHWNGTESVPYEWVCLSVVKPTHERSVVK